MLKGSIPALVTPFKDDQIDYNALDDLLEMHFLEQTDGILLCGTTGESPALAGDEKALFIKYCLHKAAGRLPVIIGTGTNNLNKTISATISAQKAGADYALVITPYYNKPTQEGLYQYFSRVAHNVEIPIIIYNVPGRTGVNIAAATTVKLARENKNIVGIKEASGNLVQASEIIRDTGDEFVLLSGEDALNYPLMCCGAKGAISVTANLVPQKVHNLVQYCLDGEYEKALELHLHLLELNRIMFVETNPIPVKEALAVMGKIRAEFKPPMCNMQKVNKERLVAVLKEYELV